MKSCFSLILASLILAACAQEKGSVPQEAPLAQRVDSEITLDGETVGKVSRVPASPEEIAKQKERARASSLVPIPVSPSHNANVFKLSGVGENSQYLVAPRVFVYGDRMTSLNVDASGMVSLPFNIAMIDGLRTHLVNADMSGTTLEIPASLRVPDYQSLKEDVILAGRLNKTEGFAVAAIPGCPSRITISTAGETFDVTPADINEADFCELNRPFAVHLKVPEAKAQRILSEELRTGHVDINVNYAVMVPVPVSIMTVNYEKAKLFEAIEMSLEGSYPPYGRAQVEVAIEKVLRSMQMNIHIQGDYNEQMKRIVDEAIRQFFQPMPADPQKHAKSSCKEMVCLSVSYRKQDVKETFAMEWAQTENMKMEKVLRMGSKLKGVNDIQTTIGRDAEIGAQNAQEFSNVNYNPQTNPHNQYSLGVTPQRGTTIEFKPSLYIREVRERSETQISHHQWNQCTGRHGWKNECSYTLRNEYTYNQERDVGQREEKISNPIGAVANLHGIKAYFRFSNGETIFCDILDMDSHKEENSIIIKISNTERCDLFKGQRTIVSDFGLVNGIQLDPVTYWAGTRWSTDYGKEENRYYSVTYTPEVKLAGVVKLLGLGFISDKNLN